MAGMNEHITSGVAAHFVPAAHAWARVLLPRGRSYVRCPKAGSRRIAADSCAAAAAADLPRAARELQTGHGGREKTEESVINDINRRMILILFAMLKKLSMLQPHL